MHAQQESQTAVCRGLFLGTEKTKTKREQPKPRREWQYNAEKYKGKASASRVSIVWFRNITDVVGQGERSVKELQELLIRCFLVGQRKQ